MTGYLQRLVLRASGETPTLKPRTPGLFEPPAQPAPVAIFPDDGIAPDADIGFAQEPRPRPPVTGDAGSGHPGAPAVPPAAAIRSAHAVDSNASVRPAVHVGPDAPPVPPAAAIRSAHAGDSSTSARPAARVEQPVVGVAPQQAAGMPAPASVAWPAMQATIRDPALHPLADAAPAMHDRPAVAPQPAGPAPVPARTGLPRAPERPDAPTLAPGPLALAPSVLQAAHAAATPRAAAAVPPPVIEVTIGRVEVRANTPAQAPQPARARQQPTSLDEYLARRDGGTRR